MAPRTKPPADAPADEEEDSPIDFEQANPYTEMAQRHAYYRHTMKDVPTPGTGDAVAEWLDSILGPPEEWQEAKMRGDLGSLMQPQQAQYTPPPPSDQFISPTQRPPMGPGQEIQRPGMKTEEDLRKFEKEKGMPEFQETPPAAMEHQKREAPGEIARDKELMDKYEKLRPNTGDLEEDLRRLDEADRLGPMIGRMAIDEFKAKHGEGKLPEKYADMDEEDDDPEWEGEPGSPDIPSAKDYKYLKDHGGDKAYESFVNRFGFSALTPPEERDPNEVPLPRPRHPHLDYNNPVGPGTMTPGEMIEQGGMLRKQDVEAWIRQRKANGASDELIQRQLDELRKEGLIEGERRRRR